MGVKKKNHRLALQNTEEEKKYLSAKVNQLNRIIEKLLELDVSLDIKNDENLTPLELSASIGNIELCLRLSLGIKTIPELFFLSAENGYVSLLRSLYEKIEQHLWQELSLQAFFLAVQNDKDDIVTLILEKNKDEILSVNFEFHKNIYVAFNHQQQKTSRAIFQFLMREEKTTILDKSHFTREGLLVFDKIQEENQNNNPLINSILENDLKKAEQLCQTTRLINHRDSFGKTAIYYAAATGQCLLIDLLLKNNADINMHDNDKLSPLGAAIKLREINAARILIKHGASLLSTTAEHKNLYQLALESGDFDIANYLFSEMHARGIPLLQGLQLSKTLNDLHKNILSHHHEDPLIIEVIKNEQKTEEEKCHYLEELFASTNELVVNATGKNNKTALEVAAEKGLLLVTRMLLEKMHQKTYDNLSILHFAAKNNATKLIDNIIAIESPLITQDTTPSAPPPFDSSIVTATPLLDDVDTDNSQTLCHASLAPIHAMPFIDMPDDKNRSALMIAIIHKKEKSITCLIKHGANASMLLDEKYDYFFSSMEIGYVIYKSLREKGYHFENLQLGENQEELLKRIRRNYPPFLEVENGALTNIKNGDLAALQSLTFRGANLYERDKRGYSFIDWAAHLGNIEIVKFLYHQGLSIINDNGFHTIHVAAKNAILDDGNVSHNAKEVMEFLYLKMEKPIHRCTHNKINETVDTIRRSLGERLKSAVISKDLSYLEEMFFSGIDINEQDTDGNSALMTAIFCNNNQSHEKIIVFLVEKNSNVYLKNKMGLSAFLLASQKDDKTTMSLLMDNYPEILANALDNQKQNALMHATFHNNVESTLFLMSRIADLNHQDACGKTVVMHVIDEKNAIITDILLQSQLPIDFSLEDNVGYTTLHHAVKSGMSYLVTSLIKNRPLSIDISNHFGSTLLHTAVESHSLDMIIALINLRANFFLKDSQNRTSIDIAIEHNDENILSFFAFLTVYQNQPEKNYVLSRNLSQFKKAVAKISDIRQDCLINHLNGKNFSTQKRLTSTFINDKIYQSIRERIEHNLHTAIFPDSPFYERLQRIVHNVQARENTLITQLNDLEIEINNSLKENISLSFSQTMHNAISQNVTFFTRRLNDDADFQKKQDYRLRLLSSCQLDLAQESSRHQWINRTSSYSYTPPETTINIKVSKTVKEVLCTLDRYQNRYSFEDMLGRLDEIANDSMKRGATDKDPHVKQLIDTIRAMSQTARVRTLTYP